MRLGIDLDGVVANFTGGWIDRYNAEFGADLSPDMVLEWNHMPELTHFGSSGAFWSWARNGDGPSVFRNLELYPDAAAALETLAADHEVVILTTKPGWAIHDTFAWLADKEIPTREVHITRHKWQIATDVYLDDSPYHLPELAAQRPDAVVCRYVRPWNRPVDQVVDVPDWSAFLELVERTASKAAGADS